MERNVSPSCTADVQAHLYTLGGRRKGEGRRKGISRGAEEGDKQRKGDKWRNGFFAYWLHALHLY